MTIPSVTNLRRAHRRCDCLIANANAALDAMRRGQFLHLQYEGGRPLWSLSGGRSVSAQAAAIVTASASVVPVGDTLFEGTPGQTWRYIP